MVAGMPSESAAITAREHVFVRQHGLSPGLSRYTPTATITATETIRPFWRTFT